MPRSKHHSPSREIVIPPTNMMIPVEERGPSDQFKAKGRKQGSRDIAKTQDIIILLETRPRQEISPGIKNVPVNPIPAATPLKIDS